MPAVQALNWFDYTLLIVVVISAIFGMVRGFVREILSLLTWVLAFVAAYFFTDRVALVILPHVKSETVAQLTAFFSLFVLVLIVGALINYIIGRIVTFSGYSLSDAFFGIIFGAARGFLIALFVIFAIASSPLSAQAWFNASMLNYHFNDLSQLISQHVITATKEVVNGSPVSKNTMSSIKAIPAKVTKAIQNHQ